MLTHRVGTVQLGHSAEERLLKLLGITRPDPILIQSISPTILPLYTFEPSGEEKRYAIVLGGGNKLIIHYDGREVKITLPQSFSKWYRDAVGSTRSVKGEFIIWLFPDSIKLYFKLYKECTLVKPKLNESFFVLIAPRPEAYGIAVYFYRFHFVDMKLYTSSEFDSKELEKKLSQVRNKEERIKLERKMTIMKVEVASFSKIIGLCIAKDIKEKAKQIGRKPYVIIIDDSALLSMNETAEEYKPTDVREALAWEGIYCELKKPMYVCPHCGMALLVEGELAKCACGFIIYKELLALFNAIPELTPPHSIKKESPRVLPLKSTKRVELQLPEHLDLDRPVILTLLKNEEPTEEPPYAYINSVCDTLHIFLENDKKFEIKLTSDAKNLLEYPPILWGVLAIPAKVLLGREKIIVEVTREWLIERPDPKRCILMITDVHPGLVVAHYYDPEAGKRLQRLDFKLDEDLPAVEKFLDLSKPIINHLLRQLNATWLSDRYDAVALMLVLKLLEYSVAYDRPPYVIIDAPDRRSLKQQGGAEVLEKLEDWLEWHGVWYEEQRLLTSICPICARRMPEAKERKCECGFEAEEDTVPLYWALRLLNLPLPSWRLLLADDRKYLQAR